jgi:hypothetical protein
MSNSEYSFRLGNDFELETGKTTEVTELPIALKWSARFGTTIEKSIRECHSVRCDVCSVAETRLCYSHFAARLNSSASRLANSRFLTWWIEDPQFTQMGLRSTEAVRGNR